MLNQRCLGRIMVFARKIPSRLPSDPVQEERQVQSGQLYPKTSLPSDLTA